MSDLLIAGAYGTGNLGDEAILAGLLEQAKGRDVHVFSRNPPETRALHGVSAARKNVRDLARAKEIWVGGGELFQPGMGWKYAALLLLARSVGVRTRRVRAVGVSPHLKGAEKRLVRLALGSCTSVAVRDRRSRELLSTWGIQASEEPDPSNAVTPRPVSLDGLGLRRGSPTIGLSLRRTGHAEVDATVLREARNALATLPRGTRIAYLPFTNHIDAPLERDAEIGHALKAEFPDRIDVLDARIHPGEMLTLLTQLDGVVSMRLHPLLMATRMGCPAVAIEHYWKVKELSESAGLKLFGPSEIGAAIRAVEPRSGT